MEAYKTKKNKISILTIHGQIYSNEGKDGINPEFMRQHFEDCIKNKSELIILDINSPGGSPAGSAMIHHMILNIRKKGIKVIAHIRDVCASGGYYIVSACDEIYAYRSSLIGSVGVIMSGFGLDELIKKHDIEYREITAGENKSFFNMFKPFSDQDKSYLENIIKDVHQDFIDHVYSSRKNDLMIEYKNDITKAKVFNGNQAKDYGLIDDIKSMSEIIESIYGEDPKVKIHRPKIKENMLKKLLSFGIKLKLDSSSLSDMKYELK